MLVANTQDNGTFVLCDCGSPRKRYQHCRRCAVQTDRDIDRLLGTYDATGMELQPDQLVPPESQVELDRSGMWGSGGHGWGAGGLAAPNSLIPDPSPLRVNVWGDVLHYEYRAPARGLLQFVPMHEPEPYAPAQFTATQRVEEMRVRLDGMATTMSGIARVFEDLKRACLAYMSARGAIPIAESVQLEEREGGAGWGAPHMVSVTMSGYYPLEPP